MLGFTSAAGLGLSLGLSWLAGVFAPRLQVPRVTAHLLLGLLTGPRALGLLDAPSLRALSPLSHVAMGFICFSAGAELHLRALLPLWRRTLALTLCIFVATLTPLALAFQWASAPGAALLPPAVERLPLPCRSRLALLAGAILSTASPASAIAVVREARASGAFTTTMLGVTMLTDVLALMAFAIARTLAHAGCSDAAAAAAAPEEGLPHAALALAASLAVGGAAGHALGQGLALLRGPASAASAAGAAGSRTRVAALYIAAFALLALLRARGASWLGAAQGLEPLLVSMAAGAVAVNAGPDSAPAMPPPLPLASTAAAAAAAPLLPASASTPTAVDAPAHLPPHCLPPLPLPALLDALAPYLYLLFFTATGATLDFALLWACAGFAALFACLRAACIACGALAAAQGEASCWGSSASAPPSAIVAPLTLALVTQAGLSMGLAEEVGRHFGGWGREAAGALVGVLLVNQACGPFLCSLALRVVGEAGAAGAGGGGGGGSDDTKAVKFGEARAVLA